MLSRRSNEEDLVAQWLAHESYELRVAGSTPAGIIFGLLINFFQRKFQ